MYAAKSDVRFAPESGMCGATKDVRFGPIADIPHSFDYFIGGYQQAGWHSYTESLRSFEVDACLELCRCLHRQFGGLVTAQNAIDIESCQPKHIVLIGPVRHETACRDEEMERVDRRQAMPRHERDDEIAMGDGHRIWRQDQSAIGHARD